MYTRGTPLLCVHIYHARRVLAILLVPCLSSMTPHARVYSAVGDVYREIPVEVN